MCSGSPTMTDVWLVKKIFLFFSDQYECVVCFIRMCIIIYCHESPPVMMIIFYIYTMRPNVWWVPHDHRCVTCEKNIFCFSVTCVTMSDHLLYIYNETKCVVGPPWSQMCDLWKKYFSVINTNVWPVIIFYIYIQWDQMCDGSRTMTYVWDDRKNIFDFLWHILMCGVFHSYVYNYLLSWITPSD